MYQSFSPPLTFDRKTVSSVGTHQLGVIFQRRGPWSTKKKSLQVSIFKHHFRKIQTILVLRRILCLSFSFHEILERDSRLSTFPYSWNPLQMKINHIIKLFVISFQQSCLTVKAKVTHQILGGLLRQHCPQPGFHVEKWD